MSINLQKIIIAVNFYLSVIFTTIILKQYTGTYNLYYMCFGDDKIHETNCINSIFLSIAIFFILRIVPTFIYRLRLKNVSKMVNNLSEDEKFKKSADWSNRWNIFSFGKNEIYPTDINRLTYTIIYLFIFLILIATSLWLKIILFIAICVLAPLYIRASMLAIYIDENYKANSKS